MATEEERHIRSLFEQRGGYSNERNLNADDLERSLNLLSEQLYTKPTHFLLELLQNADDNAYAEGIEPTVTLTLGRSDSGPDYLRVDCNEIGFRKENVEALCMIGKSTKSKVEGFIGEKGIGFKSVFKVADRVWIGSNGYTFKFERAERLGMVKPIWSPFPAHHLLHTTGSTLILEVIDNENDQKSNFDMIRHEIECLQGQLLMFLRRVKGLSLSIKIRDSSSTRIVKCLEHKSDGLENKLIITTSGSCTSSLAYSAYSHTLYDMPNTKLRPGVATTQIVLAFPTDLSGTRSTDGQMTYAFLPIRDYGLNFLLQADFLVSANRETVLEGKAWNHHISKHVAVAFHEAVSRLNHTGLKYQWLHYLPQRGFHSAGLFGSLRSAVTHELSFSECLQARSGAWHRPNRLLILPQRYLNPTNDSLFFPDCDQYYLAPEYDAKTLASALADLGVGTARFKNFLADLRDYTSKHRLDFTSEPPDWHCALAKVLLNERRMWGQRVSRLPLLPLADGSWVKSMDSTVFFPTTQGDLDVPADISLDILDHSSIEDETRARLFKTLGAQQLSSANVCEKLLDIHRKGRQMWDPQALVDHAIFAFKACMDGSCRPGTFSKDLWFYNRAKQLVKGHQIYVNAKSIASPTISKTFQNAPDELLQDLMISDIYACAVGEQDQVEWLKWLCSEVEIQVRPKLTRNGKLSKEMEWLFCNDLPAFVGAFIESRDKYEVELNGCPSALWELKSGLRIRCSDGSRECLAAQYLPLEHLLVRGREGQEYLYYLDTKGAAAKQWTCLADLGLCIGRDSFYWTAVLRLYGDDFIAGQRIAAISEVYREIELQYAQSPNHVQETFSEKPRIYLPEASDKQWWYPQECLWHAIACIRKKPQLSAVYKTREALFHTHLSVRNWTVDDCIDELRDITTSQCKTSAEELTRVTQLLNAISTYVKNNSSWNAPADFDLVVKFPAKLMGESQWSLEPLANVLIPDRRTQSRCFGSKLPWIDLEQAEIVRLKPLLNYLNERAATSHYISEVVQETTGYTGNTSRNETYETVLRGKVLLMLWYGTPPTWQCPCVAYHADLVKSICSSKKQKEGTSSLFRKLAVYGADKISIERSIQWQGTTIFADDEPGSMVLETSGDHVRVYFSTSDLQHRENILVSAVARMLCDVLDIYQEERIQACEMILQCQDHRKLVRKLEELGYDVSEALDLYEDLPEPAIEIAALPMRSREQEMAGDCSTEGIDIPDAAHATLESSLATMSLSETVPTTALPSNGKAEHVVESHETIPTPSTTAADLGNEPTTESNSSDTDRSVPVRAFAAAVVVPDSFDFAAMAASLSEDVARPSVQPLSRPFLPRADREAPSASTTNMEVASSRYQAVPRRTFGTSRSEQWKIDWQAGYKGELHMHKLFSRYPFYTHACWTSAMRAHAELPRFEEREKDYADFTFHDSDGSWTRYVLDAGHAAAGDWLWQPPRYHVEVKTTSGACLEPFFMSYNQQQMARSYTVDNTSQAPPRNVYMIARISSIDTTEPQVELYVDPWRMFLDNKLDFKPPGSFEVRVWA